MTDSFYLKQKSHGVNYHAILCVNYIVIFSFAPLNGTRYNISYAILFFIAGKSKNNAASLISGCNSKGHFTAQEVQMALYPPADVEMNDCCNIFAENYTLHYSQFVERTICKISNISQYVSATGDKWIYNIKTTKGVLHSF